VNQNGTLVYYSAKHHLVVKTKEKRKSRF